MAADYGTGWLMIDDWVEPNAAGSGPTNLAYCLARRLLTPTGALSDLGVPGNYDSIDLRDELASRPVGADLDALNTSVQQVLSQDDRVLSVASSVTVVAGVLTAAVAGQGAAGPFSFVLSVSSVTGAALQVQS